MEQPPIERLLAAELALPHPIRDLQRLLEHLEPLAERWEREPKALRFSLVPGGTDAEPRAPARQYVERRGGLDPQTRVSIVDAADHQSEPGACGLRGHEPEC